MSCSAAGASNSTGAWQVAILARAEARHRALAGVAPQRLRLGELRARAGGAEPVVALHQALVLGDHRAREPSAASRE